MEWRRETVASIFPKPDDSSMKEALYIVEETPSDTQWSDKKPWQAAEASSNEKWCKVVNGGKGSGPEAYTEQVTTNQIIEFRYMLYVTIFNYK